MSEYEGAGAEYDGAGAEYEGAGAEYEGAAGAPYSESLLTFRYAGFVSRVCMVWATEPDARAAAQISFDNIVVKYLNLDYGIPFSNPDLIRLF